MTFNGKRFVAKFFDAVRPLLGVKPYPTTAFHPPTNAQTERCNKTVLHRLRPHNEENQKDEDLFLQPVTYAYIVEVHRSTETTSLDLVLTRHPSDLMMTEVTLEDGNTVSEEDLGPGPYKRTIPRRRQNVLSRAKAKFTAAQWQYKTSSDRKDTYHSVVTARELRLC